MAHSIIILNSVYHHTHKNDAIHTAGRVYSDDYLHTAGRPCAGSDRDIHTAGRVLAFLVFTAFFSVV